MNRKTKCIICGGTAALALLVAVSAPHIGQEPTTQPHARPVSAFVQADRVNPHPETVSTLVSEKIANVEIDSTPPTEIDSAPQKPNGSPIISIPKEPQRDKTTPKPSLPQITATVTEKEPEMGDTRIVGGQKQIYILGFSWIADHGGGGEGVVVAHKKKILNMYARAVVAFSCSPNH